MQAEIQSTEQDAQPSAIGMRTDIHNESLCVTSIFLVNGVIVIETIHSSNFTAHAI